METDISGLTLPLADTDGPRCEWHVVNADQCPALRLHHIAHVGLAEVEAPFTRVRHRPDGSYVMATLEGRGRILTEGRWQMCGPGWVSMAPPRVVNVFKAVKGQRWRYVWVRYHEPPQLHPVVTATSPVRRKEAMRTFGLAVEGLLEEVRGGKSAALTHHWVELIHGEVERLARPWHRSERLTALWDKVAGQLAEPWDLASLAKLASCSGEHLRRLCLKELGRTPVQQLTNLRMQRAAILLESTPDKLETIAVAVGYQSPYAFSKTFKRWIGYSPSEYRPKR